MFSFRKCGYPGCHCYAHPESEFCYHHAENKDELLSSAVLRLSTDDNIADMSMTNAEFRGVRMKKGGKIVTSLFSFSLFSECMFDASEIISSNFDYCIFYRCRFTGCDIRYTIFSGSSFIECMLNDSNAIHTSFTGIDAIGSDFSSTDFYFSSFALSRLTDTLMEDCNLKRTNFRGCTTKAVSFRYSNPEEAFFRKEESYTI